MKYPQHPNTHYLLLFFASVFLICGCNLSGCFTDSVTICPSNPAGTFCAQDPISNGDTTEIIVQIRDDIDSTLIIDVFGPEDTLYTLGYYLTENMSLDSQGIWEKIPPALPPSDSITTIRIDTLYLGESAFLRDLNEYFYGSDTFTVFTDALPADTCKCDEEIYLIRSVHPNDPDLNEGIATGNSPTRGNNDGLITSASFNYAIALQPFNNRDLRDSIDTKSTFPSSCVYQEGLDEEPTERNCEPTIVTPKFEISPTKTIKVAVVDSGFDPTYSYRPNKTIMAAAAFNVEYNNFNANYSTSTLYGEAWLGDTVDDNGNCFLNDYYGYDFFHDDNNPADKQGHGTHIAYTILTANDEVGVDNVRVLPLQFGGFAKNDTAFSCSLFAGICAISYAAETADIINLSWGFYTDIFPDLLYEQVKKAVDNNVLVVTSAGNDGRNLSPDSCFHYPSGLSIPGVLDHGVISVAAFDRPASSQDYRLANYSNYGQTIDLAAPGSEVNSALVGTVDDTIRLNGTSMAAAVISRQASLLRYASANVVRSPADIKALILGNTLKMPFGCVDNSRALIIHNDPELRAAIGY